MVIENPFNFRTPVSSRKELIGRDGQLDLIKGAFGEAAEGRSSHVRIEGPPRRGKTSLLNVAAELAREAKLLPVPVDVSPALFDDDLRFFEAIFDSVVRALSPSCEFQGSVERLVAITSRSGDTSESGRPVVSLPAFATPEMTHLSTPLLATDFERAVVLAKSLGFQGIAFLLDRADHLDHASHVTLDALDTMLQHGASWTMAIAGEAGLGRLLLEHSYSLHQRFAPVSLPPLSEAEAESLIVETGGLSRFQVATAHDLHQISGPGEPYWLKVGAHALWDRSGEADFALTSSVVKDLIQARCEADPDDEKSREAASKVRAIDECSDVLVTSASRLASYEEMTVTECVLAQRSEEIAMGGSPQVDLEGAVGETEKTMDELVRRGLLEKIEDRFHVAGDEAVHVYLRYEAARRRGGVQPRSSIGHSSYGTATAPSWLIRLARDLDVIRFGRQWLLANHLKAVATTGADEGFGTPFKALQKAVDEGSPVGIAGAGLSPVALAFGGEDYRAIDDSTLVYVGIVFSVGIDAEFSFESERVACGWLRCGKGTPDGIGVATRVQEWLDEHEEQLAEYRLKPIEVTAGVVDKSIADETIALLAPFTPPGVVVNLYREAKFPVALDYLSKVTQAFENGRSTPGMPWPYKAAIVDVYGRMGFMAALLDDADNAREALARCAELHEVQRALTGQEEALLCFNSAYVRALKAEYAAAGEATRKASQIARDASGAGVFLLLFLPTPKTWAAPGRAWHAAPVQEEHLADVMEMQACGYEALAGRYDRDEFLTAVGDLPDKAAAAARICGWTLLTRFDDASGAVRRFERAQGTIAKEGGDVRLVEGELAFARKLAAD